MTLLLLICMMMSVRVRVGGLCMYQRKSSKWEINTRGRFLKKVCFSFSFSYVFFVVVVVGVVSPLLYSTYEICGWQRQQQQHIERYKREEERIRWWILSSNKWWWCILVNSNIYISISLSLSLLNDERCEEGGGREWRWW